MAPGAKARRRPHLITCIHLALNHSPEGLLVLREKSETEDKAGMINRVGVKETPDRGAAVFVQSVFFFLKRDIKDETFSHMRKTFRENVQNQLEESF